MRILKLRYPSLTLRLPSRKLLRCATGFMVVLGVMLLLGGCSSVRTKSKPGFALAEVHTYAWKAPRTSESALNAVDELPLEEFRQVIDDAFAKYGILRVDRDEADLLVDAHLDVELKWQRKDPHYSMYIAKQYEEGVLTIELYDPETQDRVWLGEYRQRLRYVQRMTGGLIPRFYPVTAERRWRIGEMVNRIMDEMPTKSKRL